MASNQKFRSKLRRLCDHLTDEDLKDMKFICTGSLTVSALEDVRDVLDLLTTLENHGKLSPQNLTFLQQLLEGIKKGHLMKHIEEGYDESLTDPVVPRGVGIPPVSPLSEQVLLNHIASELSEDNIKNIAYLFRDHGINTNKLIKDFTKNPRELILALSRRTIICQGNLDQLRWALKEINRLDLVEELDRRDNFRQPPPIHTRRQFDDNEINFPRGEVMLYPHQTQRQVDPNIISPECHYPGFASQGSSLDPSIPSDFPSSSMASKGVLYTPPVQNQFISQETERWEQHFPSALTQPTPPRNQQPAPPQPAPVRSHHVPAPLVSGREPWVSSQPYLERPTYKNQRNQPMVADVPRDDYITPKAREVISRQNHQLQALNDDRKRFPPDPIQDSTYAMNSKPHGYAVIFSTEEIGPHEINPKTANIDKRSLEIALIDLNYRVEKYRDMESDEMLRKLRELASRTQQQKHDSFICCILGCGNGREIVCSDGKSVSLSQIMSCFNPSNCKALEGKPKMFFLQLDNSEFLSGSLVSDNPLPDEADFLYVNSLVAKASPYGTLFVRTLTDVLAERSQQHDLMTMLHTVQEVMSDTAPIRSGERQLPQIVSFLRKKVHFFH